MGCALLIALGATNTGCTTAMLVQSAADEPAVLAALPFTLLIDAFGAALGVKPSRATTPPPAAPIHWDDPDDWVAACAGPLHCPDHRHFVCEGVPGDCNCDCVVSTAATSAAQPHSG
jgi:hypothetical protein